MNDTKVCILLISYNQESYIKQALESINAQDIKDVDVEVIVADDFSSDSTLNIIQSFATKSLFPYRFLSTTKNVGMYKNYERAIKESRSKYVAILEGDDYWLPNHLSQHIRFLEEHKECSMSMNNLIIMQDTSKEYELQRVMDADYQYVDIRRQISYGNQLGNLSACVFRGELLKRIPQKMYDIGFADWLLGMWMAQYGMIGVLKQVTSIYRKNAQGLWSKMSGEEQFETLVKCCEIYDVFFEYKYHAYFKEYLNSIKPSSMSIREHKYIPPIFTKVVRALLPPIIYQWLKRIIWKTK